jgi:hypothetical protein
MDVTYNSRASNNYPNNYPNTYPGNPYPSNTATIRGTVDSVDTYSHLITLRSTSWTAGFNRNVGGSTMVVQYDPNTQINVNGQMYSVGGLQRGDVIDVYLQNPGASTPFAQSITLVRDVNQR